MADTLPNITLIKSVWVDLYAESGIPVGTRIIVENLMDFPVHLVAQVSSPVGMPPGFQRVQPNEQKINDEGDTGAWARSVSGPGLVNVRIA